MTLAIIQARLGSTRFPRKALADLNGKPVIAHVVERARQIAGVDEIVVATVPDDINAIAGAIDLGSMVGDPLTMVSCSSASEGDVLGRFAVFGDDEDVDAVVRLTGDCPLFEPGICERLIAAYREHGCQYAWTDTHSGDWPDGLDCEIFSRELLMRADARATDPADREHVTSWMRRAVTPYALPADPAYKGWPKLSIDTPEDLERVRAWMQQH